jgi:hypothetical protein
LPQIRNLGYSEEMLRLWNFYLSYCEAGFVERHVGVVQMVLDNHACRRDPLAIDQNPARVLPGRARPDGGADSADAVLQPLGMGD